MAFFCQPCCNSDDRAVEFVIPNGGYGLVGDWDKLDCNQQQSVKDRLALMVDKFAKELVKGRILMKLGKNGKLFYRMCTLDRSLASFSMHGKGPIIEYPFSDIDNITQGYDLSECPVTPISLPAESLAAVIRLTNTHKRINLIFQSSSERDEFVTCMLILLSRHRKMESGSFVS